MSLVNDLFMRDCFQGRREEGVSPAPNLLAAERMLGVILNRELTVLNVATQSELTNLMGRSVVMDILAEDAAKNLYNRAPCKIHFSLRGEFSGHFFCPVRFAT